MYFQGQNLGLDTILTFAAKFSLLPESLILEGVENHLRDSLLMYLVLLDWVGLLTFCKCLLGLTVLKV